MFEADPNLWLQLVTLSGFDALMRFLSWIGNAWFYMPAILLLGFGVRAWAGMDVLLALILVAFATACIKQGFGLPRPSEVDARVLDKGRADRHVVAGSFWSLPDPGAIEAVRAIGRNEYGFVSGHTWATVSLAVGLAGVLVAKFLMQQMAHPGARAQRAFGAAYDAGGWPDRHVMAFLFGLGGFAVALLGTVAVARELRLYRSPPVRAATGV